MKSTRMTNTREHISDIHLMLLIRDAIEKHGNINFL
jgi:hypothetical protein